MAQGLAKKNAMKRGINEGELKRTKNKAKLQNDIIADTKEIKSIKDQETIPEEDEEAGDSQRKKRTLMKKSSMGP